MLPTIKINNRQITFKIREDRAILFVCILISLIFWFLIRMSQVYTISKPVNIEEVLPSEKILRFPISNDITAIIEGRGWDLMFEFLFKRELLLKQIPETENVLRISAEELKRKIGDELNANDLKVLNINVDNKVIPIEDKVSKLIPLHLNQPPLLEKGHQLSDTVSFKPSQIEIIGPVSIVNQFEKWPVLYEADFPLKATKTEIINIKIPDPPLSISTKEVEITIPVEAFTEKSLFVPVQLKNFTKNDILIFPEKIQISFLVGLSKFNQTTPDDFNLTVTLNEDQNEQVQFLPIEINSRPSWVSHLRLSSQTVRYFVIK